VSEMQRIAGGSRDRATESMIGQMGRYITSKAFPRNGRARAVLVVWIQRNLAGCAGGYSASVRNEPGLVNIITFV
jgi:hypothetical protein